MSAATHKPQAKSWDGHVGDMEQLASSPGFTALRDEIIELADLQPDDRVLDVGTGTGLLALAAAPRVAHVEAVDVSPAMCRHLEAKLSQEEAANVSVVNATATDLPIANDSIDVAVTNYCFHHLADTDKRRALAELWRVLRPGGRLVIGDMMFRVGVHSARDRAVIGRFAWRMLRRGPAGVARLVKNAVKQLTKAGEHPASVTWWRSALRAAGFDHVDARQLHHEGGIATARLPRTRRRRRP